MTVLDPDAEPGRKLKDWWPNSPPVRLPTATAEWVSVALGGMLFALAGVAFAWSLPYILVAAAGFAACTWMAQSLSRGLICTFAGLGVLAGLLGLASRFVPELLTNIGISWSLVFVAWWLLAFAGASAYRRSDAAPDFGIAEITGCSVGILMALTASVKLDFHSDLIGYMLRSEDNAAWLSLATNLASSHEVTASSGGFGIVAPLVVGLLRAAQQAPDPVPNAVFASYSLGIILAPLAATTLVRGVDKQRLLVTLAFALIVIAWAFHAPAILYSDFGHLAVLWCFLGLLLTMSFAMFDRHLPWALPVGLALVFFVGGGWFPIAALMMGVAVWFCWPLARRLHPVGIAVGVAALLVTGAILSLQATSIGLAPGGGQSMPVIAVLKDLLAAKGGTASFDPLILIVALGGVIALSLASGKRDLAPEGALFLMLGFVAYLAAVYALTYALQIGVAYGVTKMTFILMSSIVVALIAVIPRFKAPARTTAAVIIVLALGSLLYSGGADLLGRAWPGTTVQPDYLKPLQAAVKSQDPAHPRPIACFASDPMQAYQCNRLAQSLTTAGDQFRDLLSPIVSGGDVLANLTPLEKSGAIANSDLVILTPLTLPWGQRFFNLAGRVFDLSGNQVPRGKRLPTSNKKRRK